MILRAQKTGAWRALTLSILLLGFAVRSLVAQGFMPDSDGLGGPLTIRICDAYGGGLVTYDLRTGKIVEASGDEGPAGDAGHGDHKSTCTFAASALFENAAEDAALKIAFFGPPLLGGEPIYHLPNGNASLAPLPPRGPPTRV